MKFGYILNENSITMQFSDGNVEVVPLERAGDILKAINDKRPELEIKTLVDKAQAICDYMEGSVAVKNGQVTYKGRVIENVLTEKIITFLNKGYPYKPLVAFMERLMKNPSCRAVNELYGFLQDESLSITDDGTFLGYKAIKSNWTDKHTGTFDNHVGKTLEMERREVDDDCRVGCSVGFHVGSLRYVNGFRADGDRVVIVEVDPADVVSVPAEDCGKVRVCKYKVVGEYTGKLDPYTAPGYDKSTPAGDPPADDDDGEENDDDDWEDHEDEGDEADGDEV